MEPTVLNVIEKENIPVQGKKKSLDELENEIEQLKEHMKQQNILMLKQQSDLDKLHENIKKKDKEIMDLKGQLQKAKENEYYKSDSSNSPPSQQ
ncbi:unnamed protein product [Rotaria magnacalcarata]|uniref:Uncharacterized protein n=1 Tax=Rotaria magnacalcarata TaxID=392030 RepID=A0A819ZZB7_9BILA|nr:unnamed protein product [Rotaria magnacalcarata]